MNDPRHPVDLDVLRRGDAAAGPRRKPGRLRRFAAWTLLALALLGVVYALIEPILFPPRSVATVRPEPVDAGASLIPQGERVEDVGWLEAAPYPTSARPLVRGVLAALEVLEGDAVVADTTVIGTLRNLEVEHAHDQAKADLALAQAEQRDAEERLAVMVSLLDQKLPLREHVVDLEGRLGVAAKQLARAERRRAENDAALATARVDLEAQETLLQGGSGTRIARDRAAKRILEVEEARRSIEAEIEAARADRDRLANHLKLAREGVRDPRGLEGNVTTARSAVALAKARVASREVALGIARSNLDHLTVRAPIDGIVMRIETSPGSIVGPEGEMREGLESGPGSTSRLDRASGALVSIYDPKQLQIRVDVLFAKVSALGKGSRCTFTVDAIPGSTFSGVVDRFVHEADINQNALQVKVRVTDPDPRMRPEMLCRVSFEARKQTVAPGESPSAGLPAFRLPKRAVRDGHVMLFDPRQGGRARQVPVEVLSTSETTVVVRGDVGLSSRVILEAVNDGERVEPIDE